MRFSPNTSSMQGEPEYWWNEADACFAMVRMLLDKDAMPARQTVCDKCHGMLERSAKAILCEKGILGDERSHNIRSLFIKAGVFDHLRSVEQNFISDIANLHAEATYPDEVVECRIWYTDAKYIPLVNMSIVIYLRLLNGKGSYGKGGSNESN